LWLNIHDRSTNGAHAASVTGIPAVALRTAAKIAPEVTDAARSGSEASDHIGRSLA
jgi:hypothetical protein